MHHQGSPWARGLKPARYIPTAGKHMERWAKIPTCALAFSVFSTLALLFFGLPSLTSILVDWRWFDEVGYQSVYATTW